MLFITKAYAAAESAVSGKMRAAPVGMSPDMVADAANAPSAGAAILYNIGLIVVLVALFYVLMIMPQQRRFKEHSNMLAGLKKGDRVITGGGLVGTLDKIIDDHEVLVDLGNGMKVTALRSSLQKRASLSSKPANDQKDKHKNKG